MDNANNIFIRGETLYKGDAIDTNDLAGINYEGTRKVFNFVNVATPKAHPSGWEQRCIYVRNSSGITLLPGMHVTWTSGYRGKRVAGYLRTTGGECAGVVDDLLPSSGVPANDMFWLVVGGPCIIKSPYDSGDFADSWVEGDILYGLTTANSTAGSTDGRPQRWGGTFSATDTTDGTAGKVIANKIGRVMTARTTGETNTNTMIWLELSA